MNISQLSEQQTHSIHSILIDWPPPGKPLIKQEPFIPMQTPCERTRSPTLHQTYPLEFPLTHHHAPWWRTKNVLSQKVHFTPLETLETRHKRLKVPKIKILGVSSSSGSTWLWNGVATLLPISGERAKKGFHREKWKHKQKRMPCRESSSMGKSFPSLHYHANRFSFH